MKKFLTTILFTCLVVASYAQSGKVTMSVIDSQSKQAVIGAVVSIAPAAKLDDAKHFTTGDNGKVVIPAQKYGDYMVIPEGPKQRQHNFHLLDLNKPYREYNP